jgi:hypothetical protein
MISQAVAVWAEELMPHSFSGRVVALRFKLQAVAPGEGEEPQSNEKQSNKALEYFIALPDQLETSPIGNIRWSVVLWCPRRYFPARA